MFWDRLDKNFNSYNSYQLLIWQEHFF